VAALTGVRNVHDDIMITWGADPVYDRLVITG
jgi:hypothetical protein